MPCFRGIEVSITAVSDGDTCKLPEFPHPDGSSVNVCSPSPGQPGSDHFLSPKRPPGSPVAADRDSSQLHKTNPKISVYIPSKPDAKFFFSYTINKVPGGQNYLFFKVFMNGGHIVSWGIDLRKVSSGSTFRALYEPSDRFQQNDNGVLLKAAGIEARHFRFVSEPADQSVADDGGLVEFQVFRAKGRNGRAARLDLCRNPEKYGIAFLSDGLLDKPEETTYYDYLLTDPKDAPYASFRFHYRSWKNLKQLHLIPEDECNASPASSSFSFGFANSDTAGQPPRNGRKRGLSSFDFGCLDTTVFGHSKRDKTSDSIKTWGGQNASMYFLKSPPDLHPNLRAAHRVPQPSKAVRDGPVSPYLQRPLPDLPNDEDMESPTRHSRHSSTTSKTSITPSLLTYLEGDSFANERVEVGIARPVNLVLQHDVSRRPPRQAKLQPQPARASKHQENLTSPDYSSSPFSSYGSGESHMPSPDSHPATNAGEMFSPLRRYQHTGQRGTVSPGSRQILGDTVGHSGGAPAFTPTEGEWMKGDSGRIPTPTSQVPVPQSRNRMRPPPQYHKSASNALSCGRSPRGMQTADSVPPRMACGVARRARDVSGEGDGNWI